MNFASLPENILIKIFTLTDIRSMFNCFAVCKNWHEIKKRNVLWKMLLKKHYNLSVNYTRAFKYFFTFKFFYQTAPINLHQVIERIHSDSITNIKFAHYRNEFCTTSKDGTFKLWYLHRNSKMFHNFFTQDMSIYDWTAVNHCEYNKTDILIALSGVEVADKGVAALFNRRTLQILKIFISEPFSAYATFFDEIHLAWFKLRNTGFYSTVIHICIDKFTEEQCVHTIINNIGSKIYHVTFFTFNNQQCIYYAIGEEKILPYILCVSKINHGNIDVEKVKRITFRGPITAIVLKEQDNKLFVTNRKWRNHECFYYHPNNIPEVEDNVFITIYDLRTFSCLNKILDVSQVYSQGGSIIDYPIDLSSKYIVCGSDDGLCYVYDKYTNKCIFKLPHDNLITACALSQCASGQSEGIVITATEDKNLYIWKAKCTAL